MLRDLKEYRRQYYQKNKAYIDARNKKWNNEHKEQERIAGLNWYHRNKDRTRAQRIKRAKAWYYKNKDRILPLKKLRYRRVVAELRERLFLYYGKQCSCCGETEPLFLTIDHVYCGRDNRKPIEDKHMIQFYKKIIEQRYPKDYQILCMNCNWAKGVHRQCPHERERKALLG